MKKALYFLILMTVSVLLLIGSIKGNMNSLINNVTDKNTKPGSPFEASNSSSRYALTESIVIHNSFLLNESLARFASPDVVDYKGKFMTIFTPGISFLAVPFYWIGLQFGLPQLSAFFLNLWFALLNITLIAYIGRKMGINYYASLLAGFIFTFATNSLTYAQSFAQHEITVTMILLGLLNILGKRTFMRDLVLGAIFGLGILVDIPNLFLLAPILIYAFFKHFEMTEKTTSSIKLSLKLSFIGLIIGMLPFIAVFGWYNYQTTGSYTKLGQNIGRSKVFNLSDPQHSRDQAKKGSELKTTKPVFKLPFNSRKQLSGFYTLLVSDERSWIYYSPIVFVGLIGLYFIYQKKETQAIVVVILAIALLDILLYAMFGDPWGGWAFGPRYLIPAAGIICIGIAKALEKFGKNIIFASIFIILAGYSIYINMLGAMTTSMIPPRVEAIALPNPIPYTYQYNLNLLQSNFSSSLVYNFFLNGKITNTDYIYLCSALAMAVILASYLIIVLSTSKKEK